MPHRARSPSLHPQLAAQSAPSARHARRRTHRPIHEARCAPAGHSSSSTPGALPTLMGTALESVRAARAAAASVLLGATTAMAVVGLSLRFESIFGDPTAAHQTVTAAALLALAIGVRVPQRFAMWASALAWRRFAFSGRPPSVAVALLHNGAANRAEYLAVLAVLALFAGVCTALLPLISRLSLAGYGGMQTHFVWSVAPLVILRTAVVFLTTLAPLTIIGQAIAMTHRLSCPFARWETKSSAWLLVGAAPGSLLARAIAPQGEQTTLVLLAAAIPALLVSLLAVGVRSTPSDDRQEIEAAPPEALPLWSDRWPTLLRASIVAVGTGGVWGVSVWGRYLGNGPGSGEAMLAGLLGALGIGVGMGCRTGRPGRRSIGGFGVACTVAGVIIAAEIAAWPVEHFSGNGGVIVPASVGVATLGFAAAYGRQTLLHRVARRSAAGAAMLARLLVCSAIVVWVGAPVTIHYLGERSALAILAVCMVALGGMLLIHEPTGSTRTRRVRLWAVFGAIALMILAVVFSMQT